MINALSKILICDDHPIVHMGIKYTLKELFPDITFEIDCVTSGSEVLLRTESSQPDVLFLDLGLPDISGLEVLKRLEKRNKKFKIIILTGENTLPVFLQISRYSIAAILLKSYSTQSFKEAFEHLIGNENSIYLDEKLEQDLKNESNKKQLSSREFEILSFIVKGYSNKMIAKLLECSPETVKTHMSSIARKTAIDNRDELVSWFYEGREKVTRVP